MSSAKTVLAKCLIAGLFCSGAMAFALLTAHRRSASQNSRGVPAEFAPVAAVVVTQHLFEKRYAGRDILRTALAAGAKVLIALDANILGDQAGWLDSLGLSPEERRIVTLLPVPVESQWVRDFGPIPIFRDAARLTFVEGVYPHNQEADIAFSKRLASSLAVAHEGMPIYFEGGNFLTDGRRCFMSSLVPDAQIFADARNGEEGKTDPRAATALELRNRIGCLDVILIENPPHPHIDMYAKIVSPDTVLVGELEEKTLSLFRDQEGVAPLDYQRLQATLDEAAAQLAKHLRVIRIPVPVPFRGTNRNFTNALLINGHALVPSYDRMGFDYDNYPDQELKDYYENKVRGIYEAQGFQVTFANADALIYNGGALHCVALQIPTPPRL